MRNADISCSFVLIDSRPSATGFHCSSGDRSAAGPPSELEMTRSSAVALMIKKGKSLSAGVLNWAFVLIVLHDWLESQLFRTRIRVGDNSLMSDN